MLNVILEVHLNIFANMKKSISDFKVLLEQFQRMSILHEIVGHNGSNYNKLSLSTKTV